MLDCSAGSKTSLVELAIFGASFAFRGNNFQKSELSLLVVLHTSTYMALMAEVTRHPGTISLSVFSLGTCAISSPSPSGNGPGLEGCEVDSIVDPLGEGSSPLRMVLVDETSMEFGEIGVRLIKVVVGEMDKEEGARLGLVQRVEVPTEDWSSSNLAAFNNWLGMKQWGSRLRSWLYLEK